MVILTFVDIHVLDNRKILLDSKIASSPTNINGVYKYEFIFLFEDHFSKPTYFIKSKTFVCVLNKLSYFSVLLVPYMITFHPYQSQKICIDH